jgi:hypothetical protein
LTPYIPVILTVGTRAVLRAACVRLKRSFRQ